MTFPSSYPPEFEAVLALAPPAVVSAFDEFESICEHIYETTGRLPSELGAQALVLAGLRRAGGTDEDVRFLIVHDLADEEDFTFWKDRYPDARAKR